MGAVMGALVGAIMGALASQISLSRALCVAHLCPQDRFSDDVEIKQDLSATQTLDGISSHCMRWSLTRHCPSTSSAVLGTPPNRTRTRRFPLEELGGGCLVSWVPSWHFYSLEPVHETVLGYLLIWVSPQCEDQLHAITRILHGIIHRVARHFQTAMPGTTGEGHAPEHVL